MKTVWRHVIHRASKTQNISGGLSLSEIKHDKWPAAVTGRTGERPLEGQTQHGALMGVPPQNDGRREGRPTCRKKGLKIFQNKKKKRSARWLSAASWCHAGPDESWTSTANHVSTVEATLAVDRSPRGPLLVCGGAGGGGGVRIIQSLFTHTCPHFFFNFPKA